MSFFHCRHATANDPNPCRCPVWEDPEFEGGPCDTCDHEAEWHLIPVESTPERPVELERCKATLLADQTCPCPVWVESVEPKQVKGCGLCGHKKGWHRAKASATPAALQDTSVTKDVISSKPTSPQIDPPQSDPRQPVATQVATSTATNQVHSPAAITSPPQLQSYQAPEVQKLGRSASYRGKQLSPAQSLSTDTNHEQMMPDVSPSQLKLNGMHLEPASFHNSPTLEPELHTISAEHMRFILDDENDNASICWSERSGSTRPTAAGVIRASYLDQTSTPLSNTSAATLPPNFSPMNPTFPLGSPQHAKYPLRPRATTSLRERLPTQSSSLSTTSSDRVSFVAEQLSRASSSEIKSALSSGVTFSAGVLPLSPSDTELSPYPIGMRHRTVSSASPLIAAQNSNTSFNSTRSNELALAHFGELRNQLHSNSSGSFHNQSPGQPFKVSPLPLRAEVTSHVHIEELAPNSGSPPHPSELGIGAFSADRKTKSYNRRTNSVDSALESKPFQMDSSKSHKIPSQLAPPGRRPQLQNFEEFAIKSKLLTFSIFPRPSSHVFSPGDMVTVKIQLKMTGENNLEQLLSRWTMIKLRLVGTVARTGNREDTTTHEILRLERVIHPIKPDGQPKRPEWQLDLQIPTHSNCSCGPGNLPLPSSSSTAVGHVSYTVSLKAKRRQSILGSATESVYADLRLRNQKLNGTGLLTTQPTITRSKPSWITVTDCEKAAIIGTILTYQTDYVAPQMLRLVYRLEFDLSPDSELPPNVIEDLSEHVIMSISDLSGERLDAVDVRVSTGDKPRWHISGYLEVVTRTSPPGSQFILRASIQTVMLSQSIEIFTWIKELNSSCSIKLVGLGLPLVPVPR
ncbi:hypothetical protein CROQUDRAFT_129958 [Cronartium quercuum f. sp. fusiforme G11]|uniref:Uncharacterized protein n=1 Tax=Cronartium quercuum f. sp. fusiforme G11 TaxID=708437 RepID=A0A9P6TI86_9BASI|nr:hypothetical protein CROQUDRAFT_129958 [Cronartium quercuum f. sp. fusiforme G11]